MEGGSPRLSCPDAGTNRNSLEDDSLQLQDRYAHIPAPSDVEGIPREDVDHRVYLPMLGNPLVLHNQQLQEQLQLKLAQGSSVHLDDLTFGHLLVEPHRKSPFQDAADSKLKYIMSDGKHTHMFINQRSRCLYIRRGRLGDKDPTNNGDFQLPVIADSNWSKPSSLPPPPPPPLLHGGFPSLQRPSGQSHMMSEGPGQVRVPVSSLVTESGEVETKIRKRAKKEILDQAYTREEQLHGYLSGRSIHQQGLQKSKSQKKPEQSVHKKQSEPVFPSLRRDMEVLEYARSRMKDLISRYNLRTHNPTMSSWKELNKRQCKKEAKEATQQSPQGISEADQSLSHSQSSIKAASHPALPYASRGGATDGSSSRIETAEWALKESMDMLNNDSITNNYGGEESTNTCSRLMSEVDSTECDYKQSDDLGSIDWEDQLRVSSSDTCHSGSRHADSFKVGFGSHNPQKAKADRLVDRSVPHMPAVALTKQKSPVINPPRSGGKPAKQSAAAKRSAKVAAVRVSGRKRSGEMSAAGSVNGMGYSGDAQSTVTMSPVEHKDVASRQCQVVGKHTACGGNDSPSSASSSSSRRHAVATKSRPSWPSAFDVRRLKIGGFTYTQPSQRIQELTAGVRRDLKSVTKKKDDKITPVKNPARRLPPIIVPSHTNGDCPLCELYYSEDAQDEAQIRMLPSTDDAMDHCESCSHMDVTSLRYTSRRDRSNSKLHVCDKPESQYIQQSAHDFGNVPDCERTEFLMESPRNSARGERKASTRTNEQWNSVKVVRRYSNNKQYIMLAYTKAPTVNDNK